MNVNFDEMLETLIFNGLVHNINSTEIHIP